MDLGIQESGRVVVGVEVSEEEDESPVEDEKASDEDKDEREGREDGGEVGDDNVAT